MGRRAGGIPVISNDSEVYVSNARESVRGLGIVLVCLLFYVVFVSC